MKGLRHRKKCIYGKIDDSPGDFLVASKAELVRAGLAYKAATYSHPLLLSSSAGSVDRGANLGPRLLRQAEVVQFLNICFGPGGAQIRRVALGYSEPVAFNSGYIDSPYHALLAWLLCWSIT